MAFSSLLNVPMGKKHLCIFEIRLDHDFVVFRGTESETPDTSIKGTIVIMTSESIHCRNGIKLLFEGKRRTQHYITRPEATTGLPATTSICNKNTFLKRDFLIRLNNEPVKHLPSGNHAFPFELALPGNTPESIEGLLGNFVVYDIKATIERGVLAKDLVARKHVRVIRTLGPDGLEASVISAVHGIWPDKLKYLFEPVSTNFIFGTQISADIELTPLIDKLRIEKIKFTLKETRKIKTEPGPDYSSSTGKWHGMWKEESDVLTDTMTIPENCEETDIDTQLPMFKFRATWPLPKSLTRCRQSTEESEWIQIKHHAHYDILLRNPDGHLSELKAHHPAYLFISPNLPVGEDNSVSTSPHETPEAADLPGNLKAPPTYGSHQLDQLVPLYDGIDPTGFFTPGIRSGAATPFRFQSGNASSENLSMSPEHGHTGADAHPSLLRSRLRNLQLRDDHRASMGQVVSRNANGGDSPGEQPLALTSSHDSDERVTPQNELFPTVISPDDEEYVDYDMNAMSRMPSYNTAVKSSARGVHGDVPPTYATATSRPPSPQLQPPGRAHIRSGHSTPPSFGRM